MVSCYDTVSKHVQQEKLKANESCTYINIEFLETKNTTRIMIVQYDTMHYGGSLCIDCTCAMLAT